MDEKLKLLAASPATLAAVVEWQDAAVAQGWITALQARLRKTALSRLWAAKGPDAKDDAEWFVEHLNDLTLNLIAANEASDVSAGTYRSRAGSAVRHYLNFKAAPERFATRGESETRKRGRPPRGDQGELALGAGRVFKYEVPAQFSRRDVERIYLHLMARVPDYDASLARGSVQLPLELLEDSEARRPGGR